MRRRQTLKELPPVSFCFFHSFLDLGMGMKYELVLINLVGLIFYLGIWVTFGFDLIFLKFGVIYDLGLEWAKTEK